MSKKRRLVAFLLLLFIVLSSVAVVLWIRRDRPPLRELLEARLFLHQVRSELPSETGHDRVYRAEEHLRQAQRELRTQYGNLVIFRNYGPVRFHVRESRRLCMEGLEASRQAHAADLDAASRRLDRLQGELRQARDLLARLDGNDHQARVRLASAEGRLAALRGHLAQVPAKESRAVLEAAESEIAMAGVLLRGRLSEYLERQHLWTGWAEETIRWSRNRDDAVLLVDKLDHRCHVLRRGRVVTSFPVELGDNWMERKLREGDRATPEGQYEVTSLKGRGQSRYYKAALLDYPNAEDRARFTRARRAGVISSRSRIGGLIEIHGDGGRGSDWTNGCVALTNEDLDRLFPYLRVGTRVTVVGAWKLPAWIGDSMAVRVAPAGPAAPDRNGG